MRLRPLGIALAAAISATTWAAPVTTLDEIVVTAPQSDSRTLNATGADKANLATLRPATSDTASLLRDIPGISLYGAGGVSSLPAIHGMADDRVRVKVDGMDLVASCPNHMNSPLSYIDPTSVGRVKVFAGIAPVSVGGDSIGGTIQVESAAPVFARSGTGMLTMGELGGFYRSNGNARGANVAVTLVGERLNVTYTGSAAQSDDYKAAKAFKPAGASDTGRAWLDGDAVGSSAYKSINQALNFALRNDNHLLELKLGHQNAPFENFPNQRMDMSLNSSDQIDLGYSGEYRWGELKARVYQEKTRHRMDFGADKQYWYPSFAPCLANNFVLDQTHCAAGMPMDTEGKTTGAKVDADVVLSDRDTLRVGGEYQTYRLDDWWSPSGMKMWPNTFWNIQDGKRGRFDVYGEWEARWNRQWTSLVGVRSAAVRMDTGAAAGYCNSTSSPTCMNTMYQNDANAFNAVDHKRTDNNWDLTALARYTPDALQSYEAGYAQKTRSPNLYERYAWSKMSMAAVMNNFVGDGNGYVGDVKLKPEVARTLSATAYWHGAGEEKWGLKVTPYYTLVQDYIDAVCLPGTTCSVNKFNVLQFANQSARLYGADLSGHYLRADTPDYGSFTVNGLLNYTRGKNRDTGDNLYNIMPLNLKLALTQKSGRWSNTLETLSAASKHDVSQVRNEVRTSGYSLFNLRSSCEWKKVRLDIGIDNLFDKSYMLPLGGAYIGQGKTMSINDVSIPWGVAVPGPGRSIYAGLNVKF